MARKSRKPMQGAITAEKEPVFRTAVYARLSIEDNGMGGDCIQNQTDMIL